MPEPVKSLKMVCKKCKETLVITSASQIDVKEHKDADGRRSMILAKVSCPDCGPVDVPDGREREFADFRASFKIVWIPK